MNQRLDREHERKYVLPSAGVTYRWSRLLRFLIVLSVVVSGFAIGFVSGRHFGPPRIPYCQFAPDVIIGNGDYDRETGYWSEYDCVSEVAFSDHNDVNRKSGTK